MDLPRPLTKLIGRDDDLGRVEARLREARLVTVVGTGGVGKTRLALAAVDRIRPHYPDGAWLARSDIGAHLRQRFGEPLVLLHRAELVDLLVEALPYGCVQAGTTVLGVHPGAESAPATLITEYGPNQWVPPTQVEVNAAEAAGEKVPDPVPYHRPTQEKRANKAERDLALLGKVNPLALEEFAALEERFKFLSDQLEDLKATRKDLLTVVKDVDDRILEVFASAFEDTAREFQTVFQVLFPGGEGRLVLTDPEDMLTTGVEVEARPPGKKIKRLSLLSGGERSLTAVAMLCAIFRARPSPFYIMDEVEAALDDVNLGRLITLFEQLREKSQLLIITHQKRTMEVADALYGVTMRSGVTQVISQRLKSAED